MLHALVMFDSTAVPDLNTDFTDTADTTEINLPATKRAEPVKFGGVGGVGKIGVPFTFVQSPPGFHPKLPFPTSKLGWLFC